MAIDKARLIADLRRRADEQTTHLPVVATLAGLADRIERGEYDENEPGQN